MMVQPTLTRTIKHTLLTLLVATLLGCSQGKIDSFDRQNGATREELKNIFFVSKNKSNENKADKEIPKLSSIPQSSRMIVIPTPPKLNNKQLISFSITAQVPLKDVLIELAKSAKLDIDLDPTISGGVIIDAKNRPLTEILDRVCDMGNLRYSLFDDVLRVERDLPFAKNYLVDFLIDGNLWGEVETNIRAIIDGSNSNSDSGGGSISSNKLANIMTIFASQKNHQKIVNYIEQVRKNSSAQVLIEAKVIEVTLKDNYKTGIDWSWAGDGKASITQSGGGVDGANPISIILGSSSLFGGNINASITALEEFGTVKAIASPRISTLNNQKATLNFTQKLVYFTNDSSNNVTTAASSNTTQNTITSTMHEEPTGTELIITPAIDLVSNTITLNVQPKITVKSGEVTQTITVPIGTAGDSQLLTNQIPIINVRELKTIAKIQSGSVLVIGGVMTEDVTNNEIGIPFLSGIPFVGYLFKSVSKVFSTTETVVFIKATIVNSSDGISKYDRDFHDKSVSISRPFLNP